MRILPDPNRGNPKESRSIFIYKIQLGTSSWTRTRVSTHARLTSSGDPWIARGGARDRSPRLNRSYACDPKAARGVRPRRARPTDMRAACIGHHGPLVATSWHRRKPRSDGTPSCHAQSRPASTGSGSRTGSAGDGRGLGFGPFCGPGAGAGSGGGVLSRLNTEGAAPRLCCGAATHSGGGGSVGGAKGRGRGDHRRLSCRVPVRGPFPQAAEDRAARHAVAAEDGG
jgi:hypothetical protein